MKRLASHYTRYNRTFSIDKSWCFIYLKDLWNAVNYSQSMDSNIVYKHIRFSNVISETDIKNYLSKCISLNPNKNFFIDSNSMNKTSIIIDENTYKPIYNIALSFFDIESTNFGIDGEIIQLSLISTVPNFNIHNYYFNPSKDISKNASEINNFTTISFLQKKILLKYGKTINCTHKKTGLNQFVFELKNIEKYCKENNLIHYLCGHNILSSDCLWLIQEFKKYNIKDDILDNVNLVDTYKWVKSIDKTLTSYKNIKVYEHYLLSSSNEVNFKKDDNNNSLKDKINETSSIDLHNAIDDCIINMQWVYSDVFRQNIKYIDSYKIKYTDMKIIQLNKIQKSYIKDTLKGIFNYSNELSNNINKYILSKLSQKNICLINLLKQYETDKLRNFEEYNRIKPEVVSQIKEIIIKYKENKCNMCCKGYIFIKESKKGNGYYQICTNNLNCKFYKWLGK